MLQRRVGCYGGERRGPVSAKGRVSLSCREGCSGGEGKGDPWVQARV